LWGVGESARERRHSRGRARSRKASGRERANVAQAASHAALGIGESTGARVGMVSECRSRSNASPAQAKPRDLTWPDKRVRDRGDDDARSPKVPSFQKTQPDFKPHAQASSGSHPEGCGLGDSGSPRATSARSYSTRWKRVRAGESVSLNRRRFLCSGVEGQCRASLRASRSKADARNTEIARTGAFATTATRRGRIGFGGSTSLSRPRKRARQARGAGTQGVELEMLSSAPAT
jgi:hypothetical protein